MDAQSLPAPVLFRNYKNKHLVIQQKVMDRLEKKNGKKEWKERII